MCCEPSAGLEARRPITASPAVSLVEVEAGRPKFSGHLAGLMMWCMPRNTCERLSGACWKPQECCTSNSDRIPSTMLFCRS
eukprot:jgi/Botrbrau1/3195/Bobra.37_2s0025.1